MSTHSALVMTLGLLIAHSASAETCVPAIETLKTPEFLSKQFKWKPGATQKTAAEAAADGEGEGEKLPELDCKSSGPLSIGGAPAPVYQVGLKDQKKRIAVVVPEGGPATVLTGEPKTLETANHKAIGKALPLAGDLTTWRKATVTDFEITDGNLCAKTTGAKDVLNGLAVTCAKSATKTEMKTPIALGKGILEPAKAQQLALKEFARIEKEEEVPDVKEIFGDKDTVWKLSLGDSPKSSYYVFWMSQFSASGVIIMMVNMDGTAQSEVVASAFEYDPKLVASKVAKWMKAAK